MRKSFNTLAGLVVGMDHTLASGDVFAFVSRSRKRAKVLWYDGTGLCLLAKRLDSGNFASLWEHGGDAPTMTLSELSLLLEGCSVVGRIPLSPPPIDVVKAGRVGPTSFR